MKKILILMAMFLLLMQHFSAKAIRVCHDYTFYRVFRVDPDPPGGEMAKKSVYLSADAIRKELDEKRVVLEDKKEGTAWKVKIS